METKTEADLTTLMAEVAAGRWDPHLNRIVEQVGAYTLSKGGEAVWTVTTDGFTVRAPDATLDELEQMEEATGATWFTLSPQRSAKHCRSVLTVLFQTRGGLSAKDARAKVGSFTRSELDDIVGAEIVMPAPLG